MNCKQGDLTVQVGGDIRNHGKLYKCEYLDLLDTKRGPDWNCEALCSVVNVTTGQILQPGEHIWVRDCNLRPIHGGGISEQEVRELYAPQEPATTRA